MSWSIRIIAPASPTEFGYVQPWSLSAGSVGGEATLLLHAGEHNVQLDPDDSMSPIYWAGYLPAENAIQKVSSVDGASGGDWDQVRATTVLIADQMADGSLMSSFLRANKIFLKNASIEIFAGVVSERSALPPLYWAGKITSAIPSGMALQLTCEPDGDTDPIGTMLDEEVIRPIVIGSASNVPIRVVKDLETSFPFARIGYFANIQTQAWDLDCLPKTDLIRTDHAEYLYYDDVTKRVIMHTNYVFSTVESFFPGMVVPDGIWFLEVAYGPGKGQRRRIKSGSTVEHYVHGTSDGSHVTFPPTDNWGSVIPENNGQLSIVLDDQPFDGLVADPYPNASASPSYLRIIKKELHLARPEHCSNYTLKVKTATRYIPLVTLGESAIAADGSDIIEIIPRYADDKGKVSVFEKMEISPANVLLPDYYGIDDGELRAIFTEAGGNLQFEHSSRINLGVRIDHLVDDLVDVWRIHQSIEASAYGRFVVIATTYANHHSTYVIDQSVYTPSPGQAIQVIPRSYGYSPYSNRWYPDPSDPATECNYLNCLPFEPWHIAGHGNGGMMTDIASPDDVPAFYFLSWIFKTDTPTEPIVIKHLAVHFQRLMVLSDFWADIVGPSYQLCPGGVDRIVDGATVNSFALERSLTVPLSSGIDPDQPIDDHVHAIEALLRMSGYNGDHIDVQSFETAYWDMMCKSRTSLAAEGVSLRPKCSLPLSEVQQAGDVYAQLCRDGGLIGGRDAANRRTLKAFLARTWLAEQDYSLKDYYTDGAPGDFMRGTVEPGETSIDDVVTSPLIRFATEDGETTRYVQILHPEADEYDASYCIGFESAADAQRAWEICHKGWLRTGVIHVREIDMASINDYESLIMLLMPQRGCGQLEWMVQQKRTLTYSINDNTSAARAPNGSRMLLNQWRHAPGGARGTLTKTGAQRSSCEATQTVILDPDP